MTSTRLMISGVAVVSLVALILSVIALTRDVSPPAPTKADPAAYTVAFVEEAIAHYDEEGLDAAVTYYSSEQSVDGPWYVFIVDEAGYTIAHPRPEIIGRDPSLRVDRTGYFYGDDLRAATEDGTWSSYVFLNPATGAEELKHTWAMKRGDLIFASGWYERHITAPPSKADPAAYTVAFVEEAIARYDEEGRDAAVTYYSSEQKQNPRAHSAGCYT